MALKRKRNGGRTRKTWGFFFRLGVGDADSNWDKLYQGSEAQSMLNGEISSELRQWATTMGGKRWDV